MRLVPVLTLVALLVGCGHESKSRESVGKPPACRAGRGEPISEKVLKQVLARRDIHLSRDNRCGDFRDSQGGFVAGAPLVTLSDTRGDIFCDLGEGGPLGTGQRRATKLRRIKYEGDEETHLGIFNVDCAIYPRSASEIEMLADALRALRDPAE